MCAAKCPLLLTALRAWEVLQELRQVQQEREMGGRGSRGHGRSSHQSEAGARDSPTQGKAGSLSHMVARAFMVGSLFRGVPYLGTLNQSCTPPLFSGDSKLGVLTVSPLARGASGSREEPAKPDPAACTPWTQSRGVTPAPPLLLFRQVMEQQHQQQRQESLERRASATGEGRLPQPGGARGLPGPL